MKTIGVVVQRYGKDVVGGSESLALEVSERLSEIGFEVRVFTSCARDYISWANFYPEGSSLLNGVTINRFQVSREREINKFNRFSDVFFNQKNRTLLEEQEWIKEQGPFCPNLINSLKEEDKNIDLFIFFTYLYYPVVQGLSVINKPAFLFPTAHDELPIYLKLMEGVFNKPDKLFFLTAAERDFVKKTFKVSQNKLCLCRTGMQLVDKVDLALFKNQFNQINPYILYAGRIEKGKGLDMVFLSYRELKKEIPLDLVLIGKKLMDIPRMSGIRYLGFVSEEEKLSAFKGALFSVQPSYLESLSITTLESFSQKTPVMVNGLSPVLREHIKYSKGGLAYEDNREFVLKAKRLIKSSSLRKRMGKKGYKYVKKYFSWEKVIRIIHHHIMAGIDP